MSGQIYEVGVHLSAVDGVSGVLGALSKTVLGLHGSVKELSKGFADLKLGIMGAAAVAGGMKLGHIVKDITNANAELLRQQNLFKLAGNSADDMARATAAAYKAASVVPNVNVAEQMKLYRELAGATQDNAGSLSVLQDVAKAKTVIEAMTGHANENDMMRLFKYVELRQGAIDHDTHKIDPEKFKQEIEWATKALVAGQGMISSNDLLQFVKQAGPMAKGMKPDELFGNMLAVMEDMGGARAGTSMTALGRQVFGGTMTGKVADKWREAGMLNQEGWHLNKQGYVQIDDAKKAIKSYDILDKEGAAAFVEKALRPAFEKMGITDRGDQNKKLYEFGSTDTARRLLSVMLAPEQVKLVQERLKQVMGGEGFDKLFDGGDYKNSVASFKGAMETLKTALGDAETISPLLQNLAKGITGLANVVKDHPNIATAVTIGGGALAYGAQTGGMIAIGVAGYRLISAAAALEGAALSLKAGAAAPGAATAATAATTTAAASGSTGLFARMGLGSFAGGAAFLGIVAGIAKLIEASRNAQLPGGGGLYAPPTTGTRDKDEARLADMKAELAQVEKQIGEIKGRNKLPETLPGALGNLPDRAQEMRNAIQLLENELSKLGPSGKKAGLDAVQGFQSNNFADAGRSAGAALMSGIKGALAGLSVPGATAGIPKVGAPPASATAGQRTAAVYLDKHRVGHIIEGGIVDRHQFAMGTNFHDNAAGFEPVDYVPA